MRGQRREKEEEAADARGHGKGRSGAIRRGMRMTTMTVVVEAVSCPRSWGRCSVPGARVLPVAVEGAAERREAATKELDNDEGREERRRRERVVACSSTALCAAVNGAVASP